MRLSLLFTAWFNLEFELTGRRQQEVEGGFQLVLDGGEIEVVEDFGGQNVDFLFSQSFSGTNPFPNPEWRDERRLVIPAGISLR